jgi:hypothetical protein
LDGRDKEVCWNRELRRVLAGEYLERELRGISYCSYQLPFCFPSDIMPTDAKMEYL